MVNIALPISILVRIIISMMWNKHKGTIFKKVICYTFSKFLQVVQQLKRSL